ncbi:hypothetical protein SeLEV6574_g01972 [Synchytrium endobioticum]|uniref:Uncharacterized protein n=1 Tax=Synchytrium endobioticum TaxID=286115 RepID=A0A507DCH1_9FUNG|nr:hypothetical protein SeLEV6574_g01972 [Synchytrium endobioticum]
MVTVAKHSAALDVEKAKVAELEQAVAAALQRIDATEHARADARADHDAEACKKVVADLKYIINDFKNRELPKFYHDKEMKEFNIKDGATWVPIEERRKVILNLMSWVGELVSKIYGQRDISLPVKDASEMWDIFTLPYYKICNEIVHNPVGTYLDPSREPGLGPTRFFKSIVEMYLKLDLLLVKLNLVKIP